MTAEIAIRLYQVCDAFCAKTGNYCHDIVGESLEIIEQSLSFLTIIRGADVTDTIWCRILHPDVYAPFPAEEYDSGKILKSSEETSDTVVSEWDSAALARDLHTELYSLYFQVLLKKNRHESLGKKSNNQISSRLASGSDSSMSTNEIPAAKNFLLRSLLLQQQALVANSISERDGLLVVSHSQM